MIRYVSLYDIMNDPVGNDIVKHGDEYELINFLYTLGFDIDKKIERQQVYHRPLTRESHDPFFGMRFVGTERVDEQWRNSGHMSQEARMEIYRREDPAKYIELSRMSYYPNYTGNIIEHIKNKGSVVEHNKVNFEEIEEDFLDDERV